MGKYIKREYIIIYTDNGQHSIIPLLKKLLADIRLLINNKRLARSSNFLCKIEFNKNGIKINNNLTIIFKAEKINSKNELIFFMRGIYNYQKLFNDIYKRFTYKNFINVINSYIYSLEEKESGYNE